MGKRRDRFDRRALDQKISRSVNGPVKAKERARRAARMTTILKSAQPPYPRHVRSWLCAQLGKQEHQITPADIERIVEAGA